MMGEGEFVSTMVISIRQKSCPIAERRQILRSAYPNFVGAPSCSAQDDTKIVKTWSARLESCPDTRPQC
jgi:uncharacterized protein YcsI (UPF0317 family)